MSGIIIPASIPDPLISGFARQPEIAFTRTEYDIGAPRQRSKFTRAPEVLDLQWRLRESQFLIMQNWYDYSLNGGTEKFDIFIKGQVGPSWWEAQFLEPWQAAMLGKNNWVISAKVLLTGAPFAERDTSAELVMEMRSNFRQNATLVVNSPLTMAMSSSFALASQVASEAHLSMGMSSSFEMSSNLIQQINLAMSMSSVITLTSFIGDAPEFVLNLDFDAVFYAPDDGGDVLLQFSSNPYIPPTIP